MDIIIGKTAGFCFGVANAVNETKKALKQNKEIAKMGGSTAKVARDDLEKKLGKTVISNDNSLGYKYRDNKQIENNR